MNNAACCECLVSKAPGQVCLCTHSKFEASRQHAGVAFDALCAACSGVVVAVGGGCRYIEGLTSACLALLVASRVMLWFQLWMVMVPPEACHSASQITRHL